MKSFVELSMSFFSDSLLSISTLSPRIFGLNLISSASFSVMAVPGPDDFFLALFYLMPEFSI
jgi:hypothetical protein